MQMWLQNRRLIAVTGADAKTLLQNTITNDMNSLSAENPLIYAALLSPQGQMLNEFFIWHRAENDYVVDIDAAQAEGFIRRMGFFKLRAKVTFTPLDGISVCAVTEPQTNAIKDPRSDMCGFRIYTETLTDIHDAKDSLYDDFMIERGIPIAASIRFERDVLADVNLDILHAAAWDKGCFIGQEVAARMYHRDMNKKRLMIVKGTEPLSSGTALFQGETNVGEVRVATQNGLTALAQIRLNFVKPDINEGVLTESGQRLQLCNPAYKNFI